jgi:hypothetical protein
VVPSEVTRLEEESDPSARLVADGGFLRRTDRPAEDDGGVVVSRRRDEGATSTQRFTSVSFVSSTSRKPSFCVNQAMASS